MGTTGFAAIDMVVLAVAAFLVGMRRGGVPGPAMPAVSLMAAHFTAVASVGAAVGRSLSGEAFGWFLFALIVISYGGLFYQYIRHGSVLSRDNVPVFVTPLAGFLSGFTTMIGNLASVFVLVYFAMIGARKNTFIATSVWFFFVINLVKLPIHLWYRRTLTGPMVVQTLFAIPIVTFGIAAGRLIVNRMAYQLYWRIVIVVAGLALPRYLAVLLGVGVI